MPRVWAVTLRSPTNRWRRKRRRLEERLGHNSALPSGRCAEALRPANGLACADAARGRAAAARTMEISSPAVLARGHPPAWRIAIAVSVKWRLAERAEHAGSDSGDHGRTAVGMPILRLTSSGSPAPDATHLRFRIISPVERPRPLRAFHIFVLLVAAAVGCSAVVESAAIDVFALQIPAFPFGQNRARARDPRGPRSLARSCPT